MRLMKASKSFTVNTLDENPTPVLQLSPTGWTYSSNTGGQAVADPYTKRTRYSAGYIVFGITANIKYGKNIYTAYPVLESAPSDSEAIFVPNGTILTVRIPVGGKADGNYVIRGLANDGSQTRLNASAPFTITANPGSGNSVVSDYCEFLTSGLTRTISDSCNDNIVALVSGPISTGTLVIPNATCKGKLMTIYIYKYSDPRQQVQETSLSLTLQGYDAFGGFGDTPINTITLNTGNSGTTRVLMLCSQDNSVSGGIWNILEVQKLNINITASSNEIRV